MSDLRNNLIHALAIMDEKGRHILDDTNMVLWERDWQRLRSTLLECVNLIDQARDRDELAYELAEWRVLEMGCGGEGE